VSQTFESNEPESASKQAQLKADLALLWIPIVGLSPLLLAQASLSWSKPHLQYFPLSLLAFAWLIRQEFQPERKWATGKRRVSSIAVFLIGLAIGVGGFWFYSPFLSSVAAVFIVMAWSFMALPNTSLSRLLAILSILASCLPLPLNWDQRVVDTLQSLASRGTSYALDGLEVPHLPQGNVLQIPDHALFVEEACSGVTSLYSLVSIALIFLVVGRRSLLIGLATLAFIPAVAIATNLLRLLSIALFLYWWNIDISHGYAHTFVGFLTFLIGILTVLSLERFFSTLFAPIPPKRSSDAFLVPVYNNIVGWPRTGGGQTRPKEEKSPEMNVSGADTTNSVLSRSAAKCSLTASLPSWLLGISYTVSALLLVGSIALNSYLNIQPIQTIPDVSDTLAAEFPTQDSLPQTLGENWQQLDFKLEKRDMASVFGQRSNTWYFKNDESVLTVSLDYPFRGWHPLEVCYVNNGWKISKFVTGKDNEERNPPWIEIEFVNQLGMTGFLIYSFFDENGAPYVGASVEARSDKNILNILSNYKGAFRPITYQCQLFTESWKPLTDEEKQKMRTMFFDARKRIIEQSSEAMKQIKG
jgi:exosortase